MTKVNNNTPPYAEEIILNQEAEQIQVILAQFKHPTPSNFIKLGQPKKCWGSTEGLKEPVCERYSFRYNNKSITLDVAQELSNKLKLTSEDSFYIASKILSLEDSREEIIVTVKNEEEIFLEKPFTTQNLEKDIKKLFERIENLKTEKELDQQTITDLKKELEAVKGLKRIWQNKYLEKGSNENEVKAKINELITERENILQEKKSLLTKISELEKGDNLNQQTILNLQSEVAELEKNLTGLKTELERERQNRTRLQKDLERGANNYQNQINHLQSQITQLNTTLQTTQQEKNRIENDLQTRLKQNQNKQNEINELKNKLQQQETQAKDLQNQINNLNKQLNEAGNLIQARQNQIKQLENERNGLTNRVNDLNQRLTNANNSIANKDNEINEFRNEVREVKAERDDRPNITLEEHDNLVQRINNLTNRITALQTQLDDTENRLHNYRCVCVCGCSICHCSRM